MAPARWLLLFPIIGGWLVSGAPTPARAAVTISLQLDATEAPRNLYHGHLRIPARPGPLTLVYPKWIPGEHGPTGPVTDFSGLVVSAGGRPVAWRRDPVDMYAFHLEVPPNATELDVTFDFLGATSPEGFSSAASATPNLAVLAWNQFLLYPKGDNSDDVAFAASLRIPAGWHYGTSLVEMGRKEGRVDFAPVSLTRLVDSPVLIGRYFRVVPLDTGERPVEVDIAADSPAALEIPVATVDALRRLVREADALFGARHYDRYHFLYTLSDHVAHFGLEHHQSNDTRQAERTLLDDKLRHSLSVLSHEYVHSWNGKYRRPVGLATPNYQEPMQGELLWVYEGLTTYLGNLLAERSGLWTPEYYREVLAEMAAYHDHVRGRDWRPLEDTCDAAQLLYEAPPQWELSRRAVDFYEEGWMLWLDVDTHIRELTHGKHSLDDFCRSFYGAPGGPPMVRTYTFDDVVDALNRVAAYDWRGFLAHRVGDVHTHPPFDGIERGGWRLIYNDQTNEYLDVREGGEWKIIEASFSIGLRVKTDGAIEDVVPGSPAFSAGIGPGMKLAAVNARRFSTDVLRDALTATAATKEPLALLVENQEMFATYALDYHGGRRVPHLERASGPDLLGRILSSRAKK